MMEEVEGGEVNRRGSNCSSRTILISSSGRKQGPSTKTTAPGGGVGIDWKRTEVQAGRTNGCLSGEKERRRFLGVDLLDRFLYF